MEKTTFSICAACGTYYPPVSAVPEFCIICEDDRQYVPENGQVWTTESEITAKHRVVVRKIDDGLNDLCLTPSFAIGHRAFLVCAPSGNVLWDCIPLLDKSTIEFINSKGGLKAIAFSHPHFYSNMNQWTDEFDCPIYIHESDEKWIVAKGDHIRLWSGSEKELWNGIKLINIGGHFPGSSILHIPFLSSGGVVLCGDTFVLSPSKQHLAAMHSYPNKIPLPIGSVKTIRERMGPIKFDTIHAWESSQSIRGDAKNILDVSLSKYL